MKLKFQLDSVHFNDDQLFCDIHSVLGICHYYEANDIPVDKRDLRLNFPKFIGVN
jgi:hypothetical protein